MCNPHSYEFWVNVQFITVKNSTLTQNFRNFNHFTLASFDNTVHIHECCGLLLEHSYFYDLIKKNLSGNQAPMNLLCPYKQVNFNKNCLLVYSLEPTCTLYQAWHLLHSFFEDKQMTLYQV